MLRGLNAAPVLPDAALQRSNNRGTGGPRMEGTQLIPPPPPLADTRKLARVGQRRRRRNELRAFHAGAAGPAVVRALQRRIGQHRRGVQPAQHDVVGVGLRLQNATRSLSAWVRGAGVEIGGIDPFDSPAMPLVLSEKYV